MAAFPLKIAPKHDTKICYPSIAAVTAEMGVFLFKEAPCRECRKRGRWNCLSSLSGIEDANGILFIHFPIVELAAALARSTMTVKRSLNELEDAGLILRVRQGFGEPNKIYILIPGKEDSRL